MAGTLMGLPASSQPLAFCYTHALALTVLAIALPLKLSLPLPLPPHTHCNTIAILLTILALLQRRDRKSTVDPKPSTFRTFDNGRESTPQTSVFEQDRSEPAFQEHRQSNILYRIETRTPTPIRASAFHTDKLPSPVPDGRSSTSSTQQTAGRPFLPRCRTYGSLLESSD
jgi:hypothetical protein